MKEKTGWWVLESKNLDDNTRREFLVEKLKVKFSKFYVNVFIGYDLFECSPDVKAWAEFSADIVGTKVAIVLN